MNPLAYLILTGDTSITLPPSLQHTQVNHLHTLPSSLPHTLIRTCMFPLQGHRRSGSYSNVRAFVRPELSLESSLRRPVAPGYVPAQPVNMVHVKREKEEGGGGEEGSSTESQSHLRQSGSQPAGAEILEYVHSVVDSQYVLIEASPSSKTTHRVRGGRTRHSAFYFVYPFLFHPTDPGACPSHPSHAANQSSQATGMEERWKRGPHSSTSQCYLPQSYL